MKKTLLILPKPILQDVCNNEELLGELGGDFVFLNAVPDEETLDFNTFVVMYLPEVIEDSMILKQWVDFASNIAGNPRAFIFMETVIWKGIIAKVKNLPFQAGYHFASQRDMTAQKIITALEYLKQKNI